MVLLVVVCLMSYASSDGDISNRCVGEARVHKRATQKKPAGFTTLSLENLRIAKGGWGDARGKIDVGQLVAPVLVTCHLSYDAKRAKRLEGE
jgi:hypothetical protein